MSANQAGVATTACGHSTSVTVGDRGLLRRWEDDFLIAEAAPTGQDVGVEAGTLQFGVEKAKVKWGAFIHNMGLGRTMPATTMNSRYDPTSGPGPSVVVHNANGEKRVLEVTKTDKEARDRLAAIEKDFKTLNTAQWCERYDVPLSFMSG
jgi:hypothetical protein